MSPHSSSLPTEPVPQSDAYAATATAYELFNEPFRAAQLESLDVLLPRLVPAAGPLLDIGCGPGQNSIWLLDRVPDARVLAIEPSAAMRALAMQRFAARPDRERVTLWPSDLASAPLPERIGGAVMLGVIGHLDPSARRELFATLSPRLSAGGTVLLDLQLPERPVDVPVGEFARGRVGDLTYVGVMSASPVGGDAMEWTMRYQTWRGETLLEEQAAVHRYHHPAHDAVIAEAAAHDLRLERIGTSTYWLLHR